MGTPRVTLPISQLRLGRSGPPWNVVEWHGNLDAWTLKTRSAGGATAYVLVCAALTPGPSFFRAVPRCCPSNDLTLCYSFRLERHKTRRRGGVLPGFAMGPLAPRSFTSSVSSTSLDSNGSSESAEEECSGSVGSLETDTVLVEWLRHGRAVGVRVCDQRLFRDAKLTMRRKAWNDVVLRVRMNSWDEHGVARRDGVVCLALNGRAAMHDGLVVCPRAPHALCGIHVITPSHAIPAHAIPSHASTAVAATAGLLLRGVSVVA